MVGLSRVNREVKAGGLQIITDDNFKMENLDRLLSDLRSVHF